MLVRFATAPMAQRDASSSSASAASSFLDELDCVPELASDALGATDMCRAPPRWGQLSTQSGTPPPRPAANTESRDVVAGGGSSDSEAASADIPEAPVDADVADNAAAMNAADEPLVPPPRFTRFSERSGAAGGAAGTRLESELAGRIVAGAFSYDVRLERVHGDALARAGFAPHALVYAWRAAGPEGASAGPLGQGLADDTSVTAQAQALAARALLSGAGELHLGAPHSTPSVVRLRRNAELEQDAGNGALVASGTSRALDARLVVEAAERVQVGFGADISEGARPLALSCAVLVAQLH